MPLGDRRPPRRTIESDGSSNKTALCSSVQYGNPGNTRPNIIKRAGFSL
jgi:hypothetical protein